MKTTLNASPTPNRRNACVLGFLTTALGLATSLPVPPVRAETGSSERRFGYTYPSLTQPVGELEFETWGTWKNRRGSTRDFTFNHELEIGLTRQTQVGLSLAQWSVDARTGEQRFQDASIEVVHNFSNPATALCGAALAAEVAVGDRSAALEGKLILEKKFGKWIVGWNGSLEAEWAGNRLGDLHDPAGELKQSLGIAYDTTPWATVGVEMLHTVPLHNWHGPADASLYAGPSATFRHKNFRATVAALFQTTDRNAEPSMQLRTILGLEF